MQPPPPPTLLTSPPIRDTEQLFMSTRSGTASLPLHGGRVPGWLASRMAELGAAIAEVVIVTEGRRGFLRRLSDPFWFQAFGAAMGMDWHSSGITTSVMGALKRGLNPRSRDLGLHVCGGRGRHSRRTPEELLDLASRLRLDGDDLVRTSKLVAKVDGVALQDGFQLYLHSFVLTDGGDWVVVQQGMNGDARQARRYHWRSEAVSSFVEEPHAAVVGLSQGTIVNLTDRRSASARDASLEIASGDPGSAVNELRRIAGGRHLQMPAHHEVRASDVFLRRMHGVLATAHDAGTARFDDLLLTRGLGPRTMQAIALVAEVAFGAPSRFDDPARFAFAHGGKDGHPHPVPLKVYDRTLHALRGAVDRARIGRSDKVEALRRIERRVRRLEREVSGPSFDELVEDEWRRSPDRGGMTVFGGAGPDVEQEVRGTHGRPRTATAPGPRQLSLFA